MDQISGAVDAADCSIPLNTTDQPKVYDLSQSDIIGDDELVDILRKEQTCKILR